MWRQSFKGQLLQDAIYDTLCSWAWKIESKYGRTTHWTIKDIAVEMGATPQGVNYALRNLGDCITWKAHEFWTEGGYSMEYMISLTDFRVKEKES